MGSFNVSGSFSNLPIRSGDECYAFLCGVANKETPINEYDYRILSLPIKVIYDDYGQFYEDPDNESMYSVFLYHRFEKNVEDIINDFQDLLLMNFENIDEYLLFNEMHPFIIVDHRFFIEQIANMTDVVWHEPPFYWDIHDNFCIDDSDDFRLFNKFVPSVKHYNLVPSKSHYAGQFDNLMVFKQLYQSIIDFLDKDGYRESDKWNDFLKS